MGHESDENINKLLDSIDSFLDEGDSSFLEKLNGGRVNNIRHKEKRERLIGEFLEGAEPNIDGAVEISVSDNGMKAFAEFYPPHGEGQQVNMNDVESQIVENGIIHGVDRDEIKETLFRCNTERIHLSQIEIAKGTPPQDEVPEHMLIRKELLRKNKTNKSQNKESIDYRKQSPFLIVEKDTVLAKLVPLQRGKTGTTVKGEEIPYSVKEVSQLKQGANTVRQEDKVLATCHGRFIYQRPDFYVNEILEITSDVDYSTGNIDFPGDVIIYGDVKDRFTIDSGGSIFCFSTLDAYRVTCQGELHVKGGIIGRREGTVHVGGRITAKFIENCHIEARKSIRVKTGILNSAVFTNGTLKMGAQGVIIGGKIYAQNGIRATQVGNPSEVQTEVNCGIDFLAQKRLFWIKDKQIELVKHKKNIVTALSRQNENKEELLRIKQEIENKIHKLSEASIVLLDQLDKNEDAQIAVSNVVYSGVYIEICHSSFVVSTPLRHVCLTLDKSSGGIETTDIYKCAQSEVGFGTSTSSR